MIFRALQNLIKDEINKYEQIKKYNVTNKNTYNSSHTSTF